jgi:LuxR family maltose regulon positive regulatory protein
VLTLLRELRATPNALLEAGVAVSDTAPMAFVDRLLREPAAVPAPVRAAAEAGQRSASVPDTVTSELLTRKEIQVMRLAADGLSNDDIAERLFVAETTVRTHLRNINVKLDARNRMEAIALARRAGLID